MELESGIEKVQVLKGKGRKGNAGKAGKERKEKARQGQGRGREGKAGKRQGREMSKDRTKERTNLERKKRIEVVLARIVFPFFFSSLLFLLIFDSGKREWRVKYI